MSRSGSTLTPVTRSTPSIATISTISVAITSTGTPGPRAGARRSAAGRARRAPDGSGGRPGRRW